MKSRSSQPKATKELIYLIYRACASHCYFEWQNLGCSHDYQTKDRLHIPRGILSILRLIESRHQIDDSDIILDSIHDIVNKVLQLRRYKFKNLYHSMIHSVDEKYQFYKFEIYSLYRKLAELNLTEYEKSFGSEPITTTVSEINELYASARKLGVPFGYYEEELAIACSKYKKMYQALIQKSGFNGYISFDGKSIS